MSLSSSDIGNAERTKWPNAVQNRNDHNAVLRSCCSDHKPGNSSEEGLDHGPCGLPLDDCTTAGGSCIE